MRFFQRGRLLHFATAVFALVCGLCPAMAANIWDGGGSDGYWGTAANWDNNMVPGFPASLTFAGTNRLASANNLTDKTVNGITFDAAAGVFLVSGNRIHLAGEVGFNGNPPAPLTQGLYLDLALSGDCAFATRSNGWLTLGGVLSGNFGLIKRNDGVLQLSATNVYLGTTVIEGGTVRLAAMATVPTNFPGVQAYYTFNQSTALGWDSSGNNNTLITAGGTPQYSSAGKHGGALYLNGSSTMGISGFPKGVPTNNSPYTIACWFKPDTGCPNNAGLIGWGVSSTSQGNFLRINSSTNKINNYWWFNDLVGTLPGVSFFNGSFHHVAATFDGTNRAIYLDGMPVAAASNATYSASLNVMPSGFVVGTCNSAGTFKGWLDDLTIANRAFSPAEVTNLLNQVFPTVPAVVPAATVDLLPRGTPLTVAAGAALDLNGGSQHLGSITGSGSVTNSSRIISALTLENEAASTFAGAIGGAVTLIKRGGGTLTLSGINTHSEETVVEEGTLRLTSAAQNNAGLLASLTAFYTFNQSASLGADSSGKNNTLITSSGSPQYSSAGKFGGALYLNGGSTMTVSGFPVGVPTNNAPYTVACWIKPDVGCPLNAGIIGWGVNQSGKGNFLRLNGGLNNVDNYWWNYDLVGAMAGGNFFDGSFHLVVATWDGTNRAIYIDGLVAVTDTEASTNLNVLGANFKVGSCPSAGTFKGWIDNLMIANRAFSEAEAGWLLNQNLQPPIIPIGGSLRVAIAGAVDLAGNDLALGYLAGNGAITNSGNNPVTLTLGYSSTSASFSGAISATNLTLVKVGGGMQTLAGTHRYRGETLVNAGALWMDGGSLETSLVKVSGGPTFGSVPPRFGGVGTLTGAVYYLTDSCPVFTNGGTLVINGPMVANSNVVHLRLGNNVTAGTYLLATYNPTGSSGGFHRVPEVDIGGFAPYTQYRVTNYVANGTGRVELVVTNIPTNTPIAGVNVYEPVPGLQASMQYAVRVCAATNPAVWNSVFTFQTRAQPKETPHGYYDNLKDWSHSYVNFEMTKPVTVEISRVNGQPINNAEVRPARKAKNVYVSGGKAYLTLNQPCNVAVDIDGQMENQNTGEWGGPPIHTISIHGNPVLANKPATNGPGVLLVTPGTPPSPTGNWTTMYFLPGVHDLGTNYQIYANKSYYIPGDAIVHAAFNNEDSDAGNNITFFGHGTICGERFRHWKQVDPSGVLSYMQRPIHIKNASSIRLEGITLADSANNSIILHSGNNSTLVSWVKIFTWRVNGDGGGCGANSDVNNCFMRTQDDGIYVNGLRVSEMVMWVDSNGSQMRLSFLPNLSVRTLPVENIDIIYARHRWWSSSSALELPESGGNRGAGVVFTNLNFSDPFPSGPAIEIQQGTNGAFAGVRFENLTIADTRKNVLSSQPGGSIHDLTFNNLVMGGTLVTANNWLNYFTTNGNVYNIFFTRTDFTAPAVTVNPGTTNFTDSLPISLGVNGDFGYYSVNGGAFVPFTTAGADLLITNTTTLRVYGRDAVGNVSPTNTCAYILNSPPLSPPWLAGPGLAPDGSVSFSVTNAGGVYRVQTTTNLAAPAGWLTVSTNTAPFTFSITNAPGGPPQSFYRVVSP